MRGAATPKAVCLIAGGVVEFSMVRSVWNTRPQMPINELILVEQLANCLNMPVMAAQLTRLCVPHPTVAALGWAPVPVCVGAELLGRVAAVHRFYGGLGIAFFRHVL